LNLADFFRSNNISYEPVPIETNAEAQQQYLAGACDVYTTDASGLAATRATFENADGHVLLPEIISKEPLGPLVRHGDDQWADIARWTLNALITAEELGVTSARCWGLRQIGPLRHCPSRATMARSLSRTLVKRHQLVLHAD